MTSDNWEIINNLFHDALKFDDAERDIFLRENCSDEALRHEVKKLIFAHESDDNFLQKSVFDASLEFIAQPVDFKGERIAAYQIIGELGRGGMGAVYSAMRVDGAFEGRVAIKLLSQTVASTQLIERFRRERQILANLNHQYIAKLYDGGETSDGTPFIVMELVRGVSIIEFCRRENCSIDERLKLFLKVCEAVKYAHQQGIIHRDLKPSNILITDDGTPKLLDFGIAKVLSNENSCETTTDFAFLTPEYASPEQVSGLRITRATDVYSLGIVLYELLTDSRPYDFDNRSPVGIARVICESEPRSILDFGFQISDLKTDSIRAARKTDDSQRIINPKSEIRNPKSKDLDNVVLKSLRKDVTLRYESVDDFADDITRYLQGFPVSATSGGFVYRGSKFLKRHRKSSIAFAASLLIVVSLFVAYQFSPSFKSGNFVRNDSARRLTNTPTAENFAHFAPNGRITFSRSEENITQVFSMKADGSDVKLLQDSADRILFSPDGKSLVFRATSDYRLYVANADFSDIKRITRFRAGRPSWSPDGSKLLFSYNFGDDLEKNERPFYHERDDVEIFSVNVDGSDETNLTNNKTFDSDGSWSPDGSKIAFSSERDGNFEIYTMNADGSNLRRFTNNEFDDNKPAWSPDGTRIAFTTKRDGEHEEIYLMNADGSNPRRLTNSICNNREPSWSSDGEQIIFTSDGDGNEEIYSIRVP